jgi:hypothetical protein
MAHLDHVAGVGFRPLAEQEVVGQKMVTQVPPPSGHSVRRKLAHGPPGGSRTLMEPVVGLVATPATVGDLQNAIDNS